jgi:hypothetical protein
LTFQRLAENKVIGAPGNKILVCVWIGPFLWRSQIVPEEENFASLLDAVAEIDQDLNGKFDYSEDPFLPEVTRDVESIWGGFQKVLAEKAL